MPWQLGMALAIALGTRPQTPPALALEIRVFSGAEEVSSQTRVTVHRAGERGQALAQLPAGSARLLLQVPPGLYDVQAIRERDGRVVNIRWAERLVVMPYPDEAGRHLEVINFRNGFGALQIRGRDVTTTPSAAIYASGIRTHEAAAPATGTGYLLFVIPAGTYDLQVRSGADPQWHAGIEVPLDRTRLWLVPDRPQGRGGSRLDPAAADELDHDDDERNHEQQVNQAACDLERETEQPQHQKNYRDRPEHLSSSPAACATGPEGARRIPQHGRIEAHPWN